MRGHLLRSPVVALNAISDKEWTRKYHDKTQLWQSSRKWLVSKAKCCRRKTRQGTYQRCHVEQIKQRLDRTTDAALDLDPAPDENILPNNTQDFDG